jgi:hypothetical protein
VLDRRGAAQLRPFAAERRPRRLERDLVGTSIVLLRRASFSSSTTSLSRLMSRSSLASLKASKARIMSACVTTASCGMPALVSSSVSMSIGFSL